MKIISVLQDFMYVFYGYGNYKAPFWFIGMEEGEFIFFGILSGFFSWFSNSF